MSIEDPFFVVRNEVDKSLKNSQHLNQQWHDILEGRSAAKHDDYDRISNELRNSLRSIEWDLEDLDETVNIVEANPNKFKISLDDLKQRKMFIAQTRETIEEMKKELSDPVNKSKADKLLRNSLMSKDLLKSDSFPDYSSTMRTERENSENAYLDEQHQQQQLIIEKQDDQLDLVADSVGILKNMSQSIGNELDTQAIMLDDLDNDIGNTQNKMDSMLRKMAKVTHLSNDKRQWCAIGVLGASIFVIVLLLIV